MSILDFIFGIIVITVILFMFIGFVGVKFNTIELEKKNEKLTKDLAKAREKLKEVKNNDK